MKFYTYIFIGMCLFLPLQTQAEEGTIKIGEMMSYTGTPDYAYPFRNGWQMALEEYNAKGGVLGRQVEVLSRDDKTNPADAVKVAQELVERDGVIMLMGAGLDHVGLAVGAYANRNKIPFVKQWGGACEDILAPNNKYWFTNMECIDSHGYIYAIEAAKLPHKRWAIIAPNYEYGRNVSTSFKNALKKLRPDVEFVDERYPTLGKARAQEEIRALMRAKPEAVFNQLFAADLSQYARVGRKLGFFESTFHMGNYLGNPIVQRALGDAYPDGWYSIGVPAEPQQKFAKAFHDKYTKKYGQRPDALSYDGYRAMVIILEAIKKAGSTNREAIVKALKGLRVETPLGPLVMSAQTHPQQAPLNYWMGYTQNKNGKISFEIDRFMRMDDLLKKIKKREK